MEIPYEHIALNEDSVPGIVDTTMKVVELVVEQQAYGWCPEELHFQHPYLTLGQIHSALAYYWDHREELDRDIQRRLERVEELRCEVEPRWPSVSRAGDQGNGAKALCGSLCPARGTRTGCDYVGWMRSRPTKTERALEDMTGQTLFLPL